MSELTPLSLPLPDLVAALEELVAAAAALTPADLPADVAEHVRLVVADTVGVIVGGARTPEMTALVTAMDLPEQRARPATAQVLVPGRRWATPATAAWLNGTAGTFLELDEGCRPTGHPAMHVVPAALAVAESAGADLDRVVVDRLVVAVAAGYEVAARLLAAFTLPRTWHPHGHVGALGAATAVAVLTGSDPVALAGVAATQPLLTGWEACYEGATARNTWTGHANRAGVQAEELHRAGFTGSVAAHLSTIATHLTDPDALTAKLTGAGLRIRHNYFKLHSACALTHSALDAVQDAWSRLPVRDPQAVRRIEVTTVSANLRVARLPRPNALSTRFSLPYAVATALLSGSTGPAAFGWDPAVARWAARVHVTADPTLDARWPGEAPARVRILTSHGTAEAEVGNPRGHHARPVDAAALRAKFAALTGGTTAFDALVSGAHAPGALSTIP